MKTGRVWCHQRNGKLQEETKESSNAAEVLARTEDSKVKIRFNSPRLWMTLVEGSSTETSTKKQYSSVEKVRWNWI